jgi:hypothetical protein
MKSVVPLFAIQDYYELGVILTRKKLFTQATKNLEKAKKLWDGEESDLAQVKTLTLSAEAVSRFPLLQLRLPVMPLACHLQGCLACHLSACVSHVLPCTMHALRTGMVQDAYLEWTLDE